MGTAEDGGDDEESESTHGAETRATPARASVQSRTRPGIRTTRCSAASEGRPLPSLP